MPFKIQIQWFKFQKTFRIDFSPIGARFQEVSLFDMALYIDDNDGFKMTYDRGLFSSLSVGSE